MRINPEDVDDVYCKIVKKSIYIPRKHQGKRAWIIVMKDKEMGEVELE